MSRRAEIVYFDSPGPQNTDALLSIVAERVRQGDLNYVVVATTTGKTALRVAEVIASEDVQIIGVPFQSNLWDEHRRPDEGIAKQAKARGVKFIPDEPKVKYWHEVTGESTDSLRKFGQGIKVALEVIMMAVETRTIPAGEKVIGIGGSSQGADAAVLATAAGPGRIGDMFVHEILAKPGAKG